MENDHPPEVANLELNGLRMTANAGFHQVRRALATAYVTRIEQVVARESIGMGAASAKVVKRWKSTFTRCVFDRADQVDFLLALQKECCSRANGGALLLNIVQVLNNTLELVMEEAVNDWWLDERSSEGEKMLTVRKPTEAFVKWLAEAESESESEDGESESDEEEEESEDE